MPVEDYYSFIGVPADADRDAIKDAYRARRAELDDSDSGRANAAKLNRAWNILGDTQQRERYDDELASAHLDDDVIVPELVGVSKPASGSKAQQRRAAQRANQKDRPTRPIREQESEINGIPLAASRDRVFALVIDVFIAFLFIAVGSTAMTNKLADSNIPKTVARVEQLNDEIKAQKKVADKASDQSSKANKAFDEAKKGTDKTRISDAEAASKTAKTTKDAERKTFDKLNDQLVDEQKKFDPYYRISLATGGVLLMLIFTIPSALTGRSPGKALRKLRLVSNDGSPAGWGGSLRHYGVVLGFVVITGAVFGAVAQIAWIIALFGVSSFTRSPTRQGWHDRIAKTRVVQG